MAGSPYNRVNQFRLSQEAVLAAVQRMRDIRRDPAAACRYWPEVRENLFAYVARQDRGFFYALNEFFAGERGAMKMLEYLEFDLKDLKVTLATLDAQFEGGGSATARYSPKDFAELADRVVGRIRQEEEYLVPLLEEYARARGAWPSRTN